MLAPNHPLQLVLGLVIWSAWFVAIYGGLSVGCRLAPPAPALGAFTWINLALLLVTLPVVAALLRWTWRCWRYAATAAHRFIPQVAAGVHLSAAVATLAVAAPTLFLPPCI